MLKKGALFAGGVVFSLVLLTLSCMTPPAYAATRHVNHSFCGGIYSIYTHTATSANSSGDYTNLNNATTNNNPNTIVLVTLNWSPNGVYDNHPIGVWYHNGGWSIFNQDLTPIPANAAFNVYIQEPDAGVNYNASVHVATTANSFYDYTDLNTIPTNGNSNTLVFITPNYDPYAVYNNHNTGVWYHNGVWSIFNQDGASIPNNAAFNVLASHPIC